MFRGLAKVIYSSMYRSLTANKLLDRHMTAKPKVGREHTGSNQQEMNHECPNFAMDSNCHRYRDYCTNSLGTQAHVVDFDSRWIALHCCSRSLQTRNSRWSGRWVVLGRNICSSVLVQIQEGRERPTKGACDHGDLVESSQVSCYLRKVWRKII